MQSRRILVVANQTLARGALKRELKRQMDEGPCSFTLLVPATPPQEMATWTEHDAEEIARHRLDIAIEDLRGMGAEVDGMVGDASPVLAINDALIDRNFEEIVLSTLPPGASRWLKQDLPHRIERRFKLPVTTVIGDEMSASTESG